MNVEIYSRRAIEQLLTRGFPDNTAVVSFYNPPGTYASKEYAPVNYTRAVKYVFQLTVDDFQTELPEADALAEFIYRVKSDRLDIICQCESGQSRSAGCAAAILEHFYHSGNLIFDDEKYHPDEMVYFSALDALESYRNKVKIT